MKILESEAVLQRVADKLRLQSQKEFHAPQKVWFWDNPANYRVTKRLAKRLSVRGLGQAPMIEISYESPDPQLAANIVNTAAIELIAYGMERRTEGAKRVGESVL